ncbi:MAG: hypothetical protein ABIR80_16350, partial [Opitutaceae bacterium]
FVVRAPGVFVALCVLAANWLAAAEVQPALSPAAFAALVEKLSESGADFGSDNLISNEQSYLHVMPALERARVSGGAYVGVAPDQNFSYLAQIKPEIAYLIDLRRDNLLLLLLFKALFAEAPTRVGYLCLLTGRPPPEQPERWADKTIKEIIAYVDGAKPLPESEQKKIQARLDAVMQGFGVPLSAGDLATIAKARSEFVAGGLALRFEVRGRGESPNYPTLRTLLAENDGAGHQLSFLASEVAFQFVRSLQTRNLIVPVVGDVSGARAMRGIAADMKARGLRLSGFYISNVEYYLFQDRTFDAYIENLRQFPHDERSTVIRSVFPSGGNRTLAPPVPGYYSTSLVQSLDAMLADTAANKYRGYGFTTRRHSNSAVRAALAPSRMAKTPKVAPVQIFPPRFGRRAIAGPESFYGGMERFL